MSISTYSSKFLAQNSVDESIKESAVKGAGGQNNQSPSGNTSPKLDPLNLLNPSGMEPDKNSVVNTETQLTKFDYTWDCTVAGRDGAELKALTVGDMFILKCQGDYVAEFSPPYKIFQILKDGKSIEYDLNYLKTLELSETNFTFVVTGYRAGPQKETVFYIEAANKKLMKLSPLSFQVESVIDTKQQPPQQPYAPVGPVELAMPWWFWGSIAGTIAIVGLVIFLQVKKRWERKKLREELARHGTALSPFNQMNKDLRKISRELGFYTDHTLPEGMGQEVVLKIDQEFRLFLVRELTVPAVQWKDKAVLNEIKKYHGRVYLERGIDIERLFVELAKAKKLPESVSLTDCRQFLDISRIVAEGVYRVKMKKRGGE